MTRFGLRSENRDVPNVKRRCYEARPDPDRFGAVLATQIITQNKYRSTAVARFYQMPLLLCSIGRSSCELLSKRPEVISIETCQGLRSGDDRVIQMLSGLSQSLQTKQVHESDSNVRSRVTNTPTTVSPPRAGLYFHSRLLPRASCVIIIPLPSSVILCYLDFRYGSRRVSAIMTKRSAIMTDSRTRVSASKHQK